MRENLHIEFEIDKEPLASTYAVGKFITGRIKVQPLKDLEVEQFGIKLFLEKTVAPSIIEHILVMEQEVLKKEKLYKDERYTFPIKIYNDKYETYQGINASFNLKLQPYLHLKSPKTSTLNAAIKGVKKIFAKEKIPSLLLYFREKSNIISVVAGKYKLKIKKTNEDTLTHIFLILLSLVISAGFFCLFPSLWGLLQFFISTFLCFFLIKYSLVPLLIGEVWATLVNVERNRFQVKITNSKNWKTCRAVRLNYKVYESIYRPGDTESGDSTTLSTYYTSPEVTFASPSKVLEADFYLTLKNPATITIEDTSIVWQLEATVTLFLGLEFICQHEFIVNKGLQLN